MPPQLRGQSVPRPIRSRGGGTDLAALTAELVRAGVRAAGPAANDLYDRIVGRVERELIEQVLQTCDRVQIKAAARLGINRNTLHKKLSEFRLDDTAAAPAGSSSDNGDFRDSDDDPNPIAIHPDPSQSRRRHRRVSAGMSDRETANRRGP